MGLCGRVSGGAANGFDMPAECRQLAGLALVARTIEGSEESDAEASGPEADKAERIQRQSAVFAAN